MNISEFDALIELIKFKKGVTEKDIAIKIGRNETYISQVRAKESIPPTTVDLLKLHYGDVVNGEVKAEVAPEKRHAMIIGMAARQQVQGRYIAEIYAKTYGVSVSKVLHEMEKQEQEKAEFLLKSFG